MRWRVTESCVCVNISPVKILTVLCVPCFLGPHDTLPCALISVLVCSGNYQWSNHSGDSGTVTVVPQSAVQDSSLCWVIDFNCWNSAAVSC